MSLKGQSIQAQPTKKFFIEMLTRDISLVECILDLIDNSVDSLVRHHDFDVMGLLDQKKIVIPRNSGIAITLTKDSFIIEDTCGGISVEEARSQVFMFGNDSPTKGNRLGVYGIGMKRALFKIGRKIEIGSKSAKGDFSIILDVEKWKLLPEWTMEFSDGEPNRAHAAREAGTAIEIKNLYPEVSSHLNLQTFQYELAQRIGTTYAMFIECGLSISVNGTKIASNFPSFAESADLKPMRRKFKDGDVTVLVIAGISPKNDKTPRGWYVFCNGRMVVSADKTELTGWGVNTFNVWHSKFNHFVGCVYFCSRDPYLLPWTTTKDGANKESPIYRQTVSHMQVLAKPILNFLSKMYPNELEAGDAERDVLENAGAVSINRLRSAESQFVVKVKPSKPNNIVNILYKRPIKDVDAVKRQVGKSSLSASKVGEITFDYYLNMVCEK